MIVVAVIVPTFGMVLIGTNTFGGEGIGRLEEEEGNIGTEL